MLRRRHVHEQALPWWTNVMRKRSVSLNKHALNCRRIREHPKPDAINRRACRGSKIPVIIAGSSVAALSSYRLHAKGVDEGQYAVGHSRSRWNKCDGEVAPRHGL